MIITNVDIILAQNNERLLAFCTITIDDCFVIKDIRIIKGDERLVVAMPDKQRSEPCEHCKFRIRQRDRHCPRCGKQLTSKTIEYVDICFPINSESRSAIDNVILEKYLELTLNQLI